MERQPVSSSQIKSIGYDEKTSTLEIEFNRGGLYQYQPITSRGHQKLINAESVGGYFHEHIRNNKQVNTVKIK